MGYDGRPETRGGPRPLTRLVRPGVEVIRAEAQAIDLGARQVVTADQSLTYDQLVVSLGAELAPESLPGLAESAQTFYTFEGANRLREALNAFSGGTIAIVVAALPY